MNGTRDLNGIAFGADLSDMHARVGHDAPFGHWPLNGALDELRVTKGMARYTANFTPPVAPYPDR